MKKYKYEIEEIEELLSETSHRDLNGCFNFGNGISVKYCNIESLIRRMDIFLTNLVHDGVCGDCERNGEDDCVNCKLALKKRELYRVYKVIKGDWLSDHE